MAHDIDLEVDGSRVTIDFARTGLSTDSLSVRAQEVLPLLHALMSADSAWLRLSADERVERENGCMAMNLMCQAATVNATKCATILEAITDGSDAVSNHGFPEFAGDQLIDV